MSRGIGFGTGFGTGLNTGLSTGFGTGQRAVVAALTLLAIGLVAGVVHVASLLIVPLVAPDDAYARIAAATPEGNVSALPRGGSPTGSPIGTPGRSPTGPPGLVLPDRDPSLASAVCRYDLEHGPLRVTALLGDEAFVAVTLHSRSGLAFYGLNDRARNGDRLELVVMTAAQLERARAKDAPDAPVRDIRVVAPQDRGFAMFDVLPRVGGEAAARRALSSMSCRVERSP